MKLRLINNRYKILKKLGAGAMGEVYKVQDLKDKRIIALKILSRKKTSSASVKRFQREFTLLAQLHHPHLCEVYDFGMLKDGRSYFTMEYVEGDDIFQTSTHLSHEKIYLLIVQLCRVMEYIHRKGFIHYDLKPGNILIAKGIEPGVKGNEKHHAQSSIPCVKLMDFGLAGEQRIEGSGVIRGTIPYIAPEVIKGVVVDHRVDLYSLGMLLYEIFTGKQFLRTKDSFVTYLRQRERKKSALSLKMMHGVPRELQQSILKLLDFEPARRFNRANEVIIAINKFSGMDFALETEKTLEGYLLSSKFVGRNKEMNLLKTLYEQAKQGNGAFVFITGDVGIGKSRLLKEFKIFTQLKNSICLIGYAHKDRVKAFGPFYDIFKELINYIKNDTTQVQSKTLKISLAVLFKIFPDLTDVRLMKSMPKFIPLDPSQERLRNFEALSELIGYCTEHLGELIIVLEDLHWADNLSVQFLEYLSRNVKGKNILICGSSRKEELIENRALTKLIGDLKNKKYFTQIELCPMKFRNLYSFLDSTITSGSNSSELVRYLMEKTGGNPFFVEEIMRMLLRQGKVTIGEKLEIREVKQMAVPRKIENVVLKRIKDLDHNAHKIVKFSAILIKDFNYSLIKQLTGLSDTQLSRALWMLKRRQVLLEENDQYRFYHMTLREVVGKQLNMREKKELYTMVGKTLEDIYKNARNRVVEDLAYYFINAGNNTKGIKYGLTAAKKSGERYANEQAITFYKGVLGLLNKKNHDLRFRTLRELAEIEVRSNLYDAAIKHYRQTVNLKSGAIEHKVRLCSKTGGLHEHKAEYRKALYIYKRGLQFLKKIRSSKLKVLLESDINVRICRVYQMIGDYKRAESFNFDKLEVPKVDMKDREAIILKASIYNTLALIEVVKGGRKKMCCERAIAHYKKAYNCYKHLRDEYKMATMLNNLGVMYRRMFDFQNALDCYQQTVMISEKRGFQHQLPTGLYNLGNCFLDSGDYSKALGYFQRACSISKKVSYPSMTSASLLGIGGCYLMLCEYKKSHGCHEKALSILETIGWKEHKVTAFNYMADIQLALGNYTNALRFYKKALKIAHDTAYKDGIALSMVGLGLLFVEIGNFKIAKKWIKNALKIAHLIERKNIEIECYIHLCRLYLIQNDTVAALKYYEQGLELAQQTGMKPRSLRLWLVASEIFYQKKNYAKGVRYADRVIPVSKSTGLKNLYAIALLLKTKHELKLGMLTSVEGLQALDSAKKIAEEINCPEILWKIYLELGEFFRNNKKYLMALEYYQRCNRIFGDICGKIARESYKKNYLTRPDRDAVIAATNEIEKLLN